MPFERTGHGDPARTVELLWQAAPPPRRRGPKPRLELAAITAAAVGMADAQGLAAVTMRALATALGLASPMALYTYVPSKHELIDVMVDAAFGDLVLGPPGKKLAKRIAAVADANRALYARHPWLADVSIDRPPLGPGQLRKYELELTALDGLGLTDLELDRTLALVLAFVRAHALSEAAAATTADEGEWWALAGPALARHVRAEDYPLAARVGTAAGEEQGRAHDPDAAYAFGLARIAGGVEGLRKKR